MPHIKDIYLCQYRKYIVIDGGEVSHMRAISYFDSREQKSGVDNSGK